MGKSSQDRQVAFYIISWVLGSLFTVFKGVWIRPGVVQFLDFNFLVILAAYLFLFYGSTASCGFAVGQGLLIDIFSSGLSGLFATVYLGVFISIYISSLFFNLQDIKCQIIIVAFAVLVKNILFFLIIMLFSEQVVLSMGFFKVSGASIAISGLIAPVLFKLLDQMRSVLKTEDTRSSSETL